RQPAMTPLQRLPRRGTLMRALLLGLLGILALPTAAATYYVAPAPTGSDTTGDGSLSHPFQSVGKGIASASEGDTLLLADGTYYESGLDLGSKNVGLRSQSDNPRACILDGQQSATILRIRGGQSASTLIRGLTFQNGGGSIGG